MICACLDIQHISNIIKLRTCFHIVIPLLNSLFVRSNYLLGNLQSMFVHMEGMLKL